MPKDNPSPLFSIITVTYNAAQTVGRTLASIAAQTFADYECIVVDGASTDNTVDIIKASNIKQLSFSSKPDSGIYDAMNKGLGRALGDYVIFLNAGDAFHSPDTLRLLAKAVKDNDFPGVVYGQTNIVDANGAYIGERHLRAPQTLTLNSFKDGMVVCHQAFVALRKITGPFDLKYRFSADVDWCIRCLQHSKRNVYVDEVIIDYLNEGATTRNRFKSLRERYRIMCYYYGAVNTTLRHFKFIPRFIKGLTSRGRDGRQ